MRLQKVVAHFHMLSLAEQLKVSTNFALKSNGYESTVAIRSEKMRQDSVQSVLAAMGQTLCCGRNPKLLRQNCRDHADLSHTAEWM